MPKIIQAIWLAPLSLAVVGGLLLAGSGRQGSAAPQRPAEARAPVALALQDSAPRTQDGKEAVPDRGWIGLMLEDSNGQGAKVVNVFPGGPAAFAGVRAGDVVTRIGGTSVASAAAATTAIEQIAPHQQSAITVERKGRTLELKVPVDSLNDFRGRYINEMVHRDPRHPKYAAHPGISETDMSAEVVRRLFEQHERMERALNELTKEVHELRQEVRALRK
jgi:membrane-associated protease RseP (regulator of RpoE activity)